MILTHIPSECSMDWATDLPSVGQFSSSLSQGSSDSASWTCNFKCKKLLDFRISQRPDFQIRCSSMHGCEPITLSIRSDAGIMTIPSLLGSISETRWFDNLLNIWPITTTELWPNAENHQSRCKILPNIPSKNGLKVAMLGRHIKVQPIMETHQWLKLDNIDLQEQHHCKADPCLDGLY